MQCIFGKLSEPTLGLSQLFENNNRCLLEYENYSSLIGLQTSQRSIRSTVPIEALVGKIQRAYLTGAPLLKGEGERGEGICYTVHVTAPSTCAFGSAHSNFGCITCFFVNPVILFFLMMVPVYM